MYFCEMVMEGRDEDRAGLTAVIRVKIERLIINTTSTYQTISHTINHLLVLMLQQVFHNTCLTQPPSFCLHSDGKLYLIKEE